MTLSGMFVMFVLYLLGTAHSIAGFVSYRNRNTIEAAINFTCWIFYHAFILWAILRVA